MSNSRVRAGLCVLLSTVVATACASGGRAPHGPPSIAPVSAHATPGLVTFAGRIVPYEPGRKLRGINVKVYDLRRVEAARGGSDLFWLDEVPVADDGSYRVTLSRKDLNSSVNGPATTLVICTVTVVSSVRNVCGGNVEWGDEDAPPDPVRTYPARPGALYRFSAALRHVTPPREPHAVVRGTLTRASDGAGVPFSSVYLAHPGGAPDPTLGEVETRRDGSYTVTVDLRDYETDRTVTRRVVVCFAPSGIDGNHNERLGSRCAGSDARWRDAPYGDAPRDATVFTLHDRDEVTVDQELHD